MCIAFVVVLDSYRWQANIRCRTVKKTSRMYYQITEVNPSIAADITNYLWDIWDFQYDSLWTKILHSPFHFSYTNLFNLTILCAFTGNLRYKIRIMLTLIRALSRKTNNGYLIFTINGLELQLSILIYTCKTFSTLYANVRKKTKRNVVLFRK